MKTRRRTLVVFSLVLAVGVTGIVWWMLAPSEPEYDGKNLSTWLDEIGTLDYTKRTDPNIPQVQAVRAIGTNAIPWLLKDLSADGGMLQWRANLLLNKQNVIKYCFPSALDRLTRVAIGFGALGELGEPAIPRLLTLVEDQPGHVPGALARIGRPAIPALQQCLTNTTLYTNSLGVYAIIPGNTISDIYNATSLGPFSRSDIEVFIPVIETWAAQSTNAQAQRKAIWFLDHLDQLE